MRSEWTKECLRLDKASTDQEPWIRKGDTAHALLEWDWTGERERNWIFLAQNFAEKRKEKSPVSSWSLSSIEKMQKVLLRIFPCVL